MKLFHNCMSAADDLVSKDDPMLTEAALSGPSAVSGSTTGGGLTASSSQDSLFLGDDSSSSNDFEASDRVCSVKLLRTSSWLSFNAFIVCYLFGLCGIGVAWFLPVKI